MTAFMCLSCADSGDPCDVCGPSSSPELPLLLVSLLMVIAGVAVAVLSCRGPWRWS